MCRSVTDGIEDRKVSLAGSKRWQLNLGSARDQRVDRPFHVLTDRLREQIELLLRKGDAVPRAIAQQDVSHVLWRSRRCCACHDLRSNNCLDDEAKLGDDLTQQKPRE
jgi:hypothetical protein